MLSLAQLLWPKVPPVEIMSDVGLRMYGSIIFMAYPQNIIELGLFDHGVVVEKGTKKSILY